MKMGQHLQLHSMKPLILNANKIKNMNINLEILFFENITLNKVL
jgi:hypothetical protein